MFSEYSLVYGADRLVRDLLRSYVELYYFAALASGATFAACLMALDVGDTTMNNELIELLEYLRTLDPDEVVDYLGLDTETLVDNLIGVADDWLAEKEEEYDE
jgi:hypothetical protein